jgi:hypothetical protein
MTLTPHDVKLVVSALRELALADRAAYRLRLADDNAGGADAALARSEACLALADRLDVAQL